MGQFVLLGRLAARDLRRRSAQAVLLLIAICAASATLTIGLALRGITSAPFQLTKAATAGPDVIGMTIPPQEAQDNPPAKVTIPASRADLDALAGERGVTAHAGPFPVTWVKLAADGRTGAVMAEGRGSDTGPIDRPKLTQGSWAGQGTVVVERGFATAFDLRTGDAVRLNGRQFLISGIAVTSAIPEYPQLCSFVCLFDNQLSAYNPGLVWLTTSVAASLASPREPISYVMDYKLADPQGAEAFTSSHAHVKASDPYLMSWQDISAQDGLAVTIERRVLVAGSWILALLAVTSVAVLVGGRMAEQTRRVGLLKAVGATPGLVAAVLIVEHLVIGLAAAAAGLLVGWLITPLVTNVGAGLLGAAPAPSLTVPGILLVVAAAVAVAVMATLVPAIRAARTSTIRALADAARSPRRSRWLIWLSARLPVPVLIGIRLAAGRPRRLILAVLSTFVTVSGVIAVLVVHASDDQQLGGASGVSNPQTTMLNEVTLVLSVMLIALAAVNAIFITWGTVLDARHSSALQRALGATPAQVTAGVSVAQVLPALVGALAGIPGGIGLYSVAKNGGSTVVPPTWWLAAAVLASLVALVALTAVPAFIGARRPPADLLRSEAA